MVWRLLRPCDITHDERYNYWLKLKDAKDASKESGIIANGEKDISIEESGKFDTTSSLV